MSSPVALILGIGPRTGSPIARHFLNNGYKVAAVSRSNKEASTDPNRINLSADLTNPKEITNVFDKAKAAFGLPHVVVWNAAGLSVTPADDPLALSPEDLTKDLAINTVGAYVAAKEAVKVFGEISGPASKTFIYTGNALNQTNMARLVSLGVGKSASSHFIEAAAAAYSPRGYKFYYADERKADGTSVGGGIDGEAHGQFYLDLARAEKQLDWLQTFVKGSGYMKVDKYPQ